MTNEVEAEKCGPESDSGMAMAYRPGGGATTFAELFAFRDAQQADSAYWGATYDYRDLSNNILNDMMMSAPQKADALMALTKEFQTVVKNAPDLYAIKELEAEGEKARKPGLVKGALKAALKLFHPEQPKAPAEKSLPEQIEEVIGSDEVSGFKVIDSPDGPRWLSFSSNAFEDKEKELFSTKAHEEAIAYADATGQHGPLRLYHVDGADIGDADFQAMAGRFLVESGTFRDDALGKAAVKYFKEHPDEKFQVSIGYWFKEGDDLDGTYDWLRYRERSVCPMNKAANPFTGFVIGEIGEKTVDANKAKMLTDILGADLAQTIISRAETATKELEAAGVRFKTLPESKGIKEDMEGLMAEMTPEMKTKMQAIMDKLPPEGKKDDDAVATSSEQTQQAQTQAVGEIDGPVAVALVALTERVGTLVDSLTTVQTEVKELRDAEKERQERAPRAVASMFRESGAQGMTLDAAKVKELTGEKDEPPANPVTPYILDLVGGIR